MAKIIDLAKSGWRIFSDLDTFFGFSANNPKKTDEQTGLTAHKKGKDQADERITITAFARSIERLLKEYGPGSAEELIMDRADATARAHKLMRIINAYTPPERRCISLTLGLRQESETSPEVASSKKKKKGKKSEPYKRFENRSGQDMIIMMALANNEQFTRETLRMMLVDSDIKKHNIQQSLEIAEAVISGIKKSNQKKRKEPFQPPLWVDFLPIGRTKIVKKMEEEYNKEAA